MNLYDKKGYNLSTFVLAKLKTYINAYKFAYDLLNWVLSISISMRRKGREKSHLITFYYTHAHMYENGHRSAKNGVIRE